MSEIAKQLQQARPKLKRVAPLTAALSWGFFWINIVIGIGLMFLYTQTTSPIAVVNILSYRQWGAIFFLTSLAMGYALLKNNWKMIKNLQIVGLVLKSIWLVALIIRCIANPTTILITAVWAFFAYVQAALYVHFLPTVSLKDDKHV